ncbi:hypothetical protein Val02_09900 [Virgisporangium aliadipatigenens]|uniref:Phosphoglycerate mutase n=1 Tax=Virgisporangium aliadipatigenens TaxID=741659 RepID=A0A8J3YFB9_9ACTN|nr:histidine phosphatase family protein [Virgisporangium aliadipatigenens]GIJ44104.1 hypothetical protein Val02_09900 [Virgisporangium aliadipatigenens]
MATEVVLVRHARSVVPTAGGPDEFRRPLAPDGLRRAAALADALTPADAVWSSPYLRAIQTVGPAARRLGLPVLTGRDLREWDHGFAFTLDWMPHYERSWAEPAFARPTGESLDALTARAVAAVRGLAARHDGGRVLLGSHGTFVSRALCGFGASRVDWAFSRDMPMPAVYRLRFDAPGDTPAISGPGVAPG